MKKVLGAVFTLAIAFAFPALAEEKAGPLGTWELKQDKDSVELYVQKGPGSASVIYQVCHTGGPNVVVRGAEGSSRDLSVGRCIDIASKGSISIVRASTTSRAAARGTYQLVTATQLGPNG